MYSTLKPCFPGFGSLWRTGLKGMVLTCIFFALFVILATFSFSANVAAEPPSILILQSYHQNFDWTNSVSEGLLKTFEECLPKAQLSIEYMDTKRHSPESLFDILEEYYLQKYSKNKPDIVIVVDNNALSFALTRCQGLFADLPLLFCGINNFTDEMLGERQNVSGVVEELSILGTINMALDILPSTHRFIVVTDKTPTGQMCRALTEKVISENPDLPPVEIIDDVTEAELIKRISSAAPDEVVLLFMFHLDAQGKRFENEEFLVLVDDNSSVPVFVPQEHMLGFGAVGGVLQGGFHHGRVVVEMAEQILKGVDPDDIPIDRKGPNTQLVDYRQLKRWNIPLSAVPEGTEFEFLPITFYQQYTMLVWGLIIAISTLLTLITGLTLEIRKRRKSEFALAVSEANYREIFNTTSEAIILVGSKAEIIDVNESMLMMYGYTKDEIIGGTVEQLSADMPLYNTEHAAIKIKELFEKGPQLFEWLARHKDGHDFWVEVALTISTIGGEDSVLSVVRDIGQRKKLEDQLLQSQKMEAIGRLAGGAAHDFNNILTSIIGYAELLQVTYNDKSTDDGEAVSVILESAGRAADLTQQLLGFARKGKYTPEPVEFNSLIQHVLKVMDKIFEKNIHVVEQFGIIPNVLADRNQIEQVLTNLIINAKDSMPDGGTLTINTEEIYLDSDMLVSSEDIEPGPYVKTSITDTGTGMSKEIVEHIFEPFFTTKTKEKGTGLGLAMVYGIVNNHGGKINVYSEEGVGTSFSIYLPVSFGAAVDKSPESTIISGDASVLLIDDEDAIRSYIKKRLEQFGYRVMTAENGVKGLKLYKEHHDDIDVVLLDMIMPTMPGRETYQALKEINSDVKVIVMSGFSKTEKVSDIMNGGAATFIQKPFRIQDLTQAIHDVLE